MRLLTLLYIICFTLPVVAQYAPQAGVTGSTAISQNDNRIVGWASDCVVTRGWLDIADKPLGKASFGADIDGTGSPDNGLVSLGDSGVAVLTFPSVIYNGEGPDFLIFENGFVNPKNPEEAFLELAFVEVSSDGVNYFRFPASSETDTPQVPVAGVYMNARKLNNLAGKYMKGYGTPFDLEELKGTIGLDVDNITHVRLIDVVGAIEGNSSFDKDGNPINDPYPTVLAAGGFDLDAVGALYMLGKWPTSLGQITEGGITLSPNPARNALRVQSRNDIISVIITDVTGRQVMQSFLHSKEIVLDIQSLNTGIYYLTLNGQNNEQCVRLFYKY